MTGHAEGDPIVAFNEILSEVIDTIFEIKQAYWKASLDKELHDELGHLFDDLVSWKTLLSDRDNDLGVSALSFMSSAASRTLHSIWPGNPTFGEVRALVDEHLSRLAAHLAVVLAEQVNEMSRSALAEVLSGVNAHRELLAGLVGGDEKAKRSPGPT